MLQPLAADTAWEIEARQVTAWRAMTPAQKADLISGISVAVRDLARAGVRHRFPEASPREQFLRLAILTLGLDLARRAYPDIDALGLR
ncbi:MAG: hypothetical protein ABI039_10520 [Vicinamibacterales bacterium]